MQAFPWSGLAARVVLLALVATQLASCGSGAVSGTGSSTGPIVVSPGTVVAYSDLPTTFLISGGNGSYLVTSSNQAVLPVADVTNSRSITVIPSPVGSDTTVTLTVRDTANSSAGTSTITVKPRTISNVVSVTPSSTVCGNSLCAGGDAEVAVYLTQADVPLVGRTVRFDVVSGDLRIYTQSGSQSDVLATSGIAVTDSTGRASVRVKALDSASGQTVLLDVTDTASGAAVRTAVAIAPAATAPLTAQPTTIDFLGPNSTSCANGQSAQALVFGGKPPYSVSLPGVFAVSPSILTDNPGRITITATGGCSDGTQIVIVDAAGASATITATNKVSSVATSPFDVAPNTVTLTGCGQSATVALVGGSGRYFQATGSNVLNIAPPTPTPSGTWVGVITRQAQTDAGGGNPAPTTFTTTVNAAFSDGQTTKTVAVKLNGAGGGYCGT